MPGLVGNPIRILSNVAVSDAEPTSLAAIFSNSPGRDSMDRMAALRVTFEYTSGIYFPSRLQILTSQKNNSSVLSVRVIFGLFLGVFESVVSIA